ncbi:MAG TPA: transposase [Chloroflexia bacterium]|nr:transposase [Chloroflexia bacterium]
MDDDLLSPALWAAVAPLLPAEPRPPQGGNPCLRNQDVLRGILYILTRGLAWADLPPALGAGSGRACRRRWRAWEQAGVGAPILAVLREAGVVLAPRPPRGPRAGGRAPRRRAVPALGRAGTWGARLKQHRQRQGLTQAGLARRVPCAVITIRKLEGGHRRPSPLLARLLMNVLDGPGDATAAVVAEAGPPAAWPSGEWSDSL